MASLVNKMKFPTLIEPPLKTHATSLIFLHGSGDTGDGIKNWLKGVLFKELSFPHTKVIYPTAPVRAYTPAAGHPSTVWFDRTKISPFVPEHTETMENACDVIKKLIEKEESCGIQQDHIVLGGFSMGGSLALYYGYKYGANLAGIFALSSFLNSESDAYKVLESSGCKGPPLFQTHGQHDCLVPIDWGQQTHARLRQLGVPATWGTYPIAHELNGKQIADLLHWLQATLPQSEPLPPRCDLQNCD